MPLGIHTAHLFESGVPINIAAVGREITSSSSFPGTGQYVILQRDRSQHKLMVLAATKLGNKCLELKSGKGCILKKCKGTYVMRFPPGTAQAGIVRKTARKWNLGLPLCTCLSSAVHFCRSRAHGESSHSWSLTHHSKILWETHPRTPARGVAELPGNLPVAFAWEAPEEYNDGNVSFCLTSLAALGPFSVPLLILLYSTTTAPRSYLSRLDSKMGSNKERQINT